jgi:hypothetical protein
LSEQTLSNLSREERRFEPPADLAADANVKEEAYARADSDRDAFWTDAADRLDWGRKWDQVLDWSNPALREVVRRRHHQRRGQLRGSPRRRRQRRQGGPALDRRAH